MPPISLKKTIIVILIVVMLSRLDHVIAFISSIYQAFYDSFEPLRNSSPEGRYLVTLAFLSLCFVVIWHLFLRKK